jgi:hypothetical protein
MIAGSDKSSNKLLLPRSVRRAVDAMHANVGRAWTVPELGRGRRRFQPDATAAISRLSP